MEVFNHYIPEEERETTLLILAKKRKLREEATLAAEAKRKTAKTRKIVLQLDPTKYAQFADADLEAIINAHIATMEGTTGAGKATKAAVGTTGKKAKATDAVNAAINTQAAATKKREALARQRKLLTK